MKIQHGLISADSHGQLEKDAYLKRMSRAKWGDLIPHIAEVTDVRYGYLRHLSQGASPSVSIP